MTYPKGPCTLLFCTWALKSLNRRYFKAQVFLFLGTWTLRATVDSKTLEHPYPHTPKGVLKGIPALTMLKPCSPLLEFSVS